VIRFNCSCGKRLKVDDDFVGRQVKCPNCGVKTVVPQVPDAEVEEAVPVTNDPAAAGLEALTQALKAKPSVAKPIRRNVPALKAISGRPAAPGRATAPAARNRKQTPGGKIGQNGRFAKPASANHNALYIGLGAALGAIVIVVVAAILIGGGCEGKSKAPLPPPPPPPPPPSPSAPAYTPPIKPAHEGPWPGEMWPGKKWEDK
jgi:DNA-directed RNA polymerase subunit RPC12/RpoP